MTSLNIEKASAVAVGINVQGGVGSQLLGVVFAPFRRPEQPRLFAVPSAKDDRALRLPSLLEKLGERTGFFKKSNLAGDGVLGAVDPGVVVVAANDPLVRRCAPESWL